MTLPASGAISMSQVNTELGVATTTTSSLNDSAVRTLFGKASGTISMSDGYGKANQFNGAIASNQTNLNLRTWALANGWNGSSAAVITINSGAYVYSTSTGTPGLTIDGSWPAGVTLVNNGFIMGKGGDGGGWPLAQMSGYNGGNAISLGVNCTITNNSYIGGGGGGGGAEYYNVMGGGGGAGGGAGGGCQYGSGPYPQPAPSTGGGPGSAGANGTYYPGGGSGKSAWGPVAGSGAGGRIMPGSGGAGTRNAQYSGTGGYGGGAGGGATSNGGSGSYGGSGGSAGNSGGSYSGQGAGGGGGWGASGGTGRYVAGGGSGGKAIALNGYTATRNGAGTTYGAVS